MAQFYRKRTRSSLCAHFLTGKRQEDRKTSLDLYLLCVFALLLCFTIFILNFFFTGFICRLFFLTVDGQHFIKPRKWRQIFAIEEYIGDDFADCFLRQTSIQCFKQPLFWFSKQQHRKIVGKDAENFAIFWMARSINPEVV